MKLEEGEVLAPTMFKLEHRRPDQNGDTPPATDVECVNCTRKYPFQDLMKGELREDLCPGCSTTPEGLWGQGCREPWWTKRLFSKAAIWAKREGEING